MLSYKQIQATSYPSKSLLLIHGIMGSSSNVVSIARKLATEVFVDYQLILPDLDHSRHHIQECVQDMLDLLCQLGISVDVIIGHSFGAKVALLLNEQIPVRRVWVWDADPNSLPLGSTYQILQKLKKIPMPQPDRQTLKKMMIQSGISQKIAVWMSTNVQESEGGFQWRFDLDCIEDLLKSFSETAVVPQMNTHFVRAGHDSHMLLSESDFVHILPSAGHWVHIDNPQGLIEIMKDSL